MIVINHDDCWLYAGQITYQGYARLGVYDKTDNKIHGYMVHRLMYENYVGSIPEGYVIDHLCRVKACINPSHLDAVTSAENTQRGITKNKTHCKSGHPFNERNTIITNRGWRQCRECHRLRLQRRYDKVRVNPRVI